MSKYDENTTPMSHDKGSVELCPPTWAFVLTVLVPQLYREDRPEEALTLLEDAAQKLDYAVKQQRDGEEESG